MEDFWLCFVPLFVAVDAIGLFANLVLAWIVLWFSDGIARFLGRNGIRIVSKVVHLILAAIAVKMVRTGVEGIVEKMAKGFPH